MSPSHAQAGLTFMFEGGRLTLISVAEPSSVATAKGIKIGATAEQVRRAYGRQLEVGPNYYEEPPAQYLTSWTERGKRGLRFQTDVHRRVHVIHAGTSSIRYVEGCL